MLLPRGHVLIALVQFLKLLTAAPISSSTITTYPSIPFFQNSNLFSVTANSLSIQVPIVATYHTSTFSATSDQPILIQVTSLSGPIQLFGLAPPIPSAGATINGDVLTFYLTAPLKVEVRFNSAVFKQGDLASSEVLYLVVDLPEVLSQIPSSNDPSVLYFQPGVYNLGLMLYNSSFPPPSQIYLAPGALVNAAWRFVGVSDVTISGRGYLRNAFQDKSQNMIYFSGSQDVIIRDVFVVDSPQHVIAISSGSVGLSISSHFLIDNIKSLHRGGNSDGFSFFGPVNNVLVQNTLLVNVDNQIIFQAGLPSGPFSNTFRNNIFIKSSSGGNFMVLQAPSAATFGTNDAENSIFGTNNLFTNFDIPRLSGSTAFLSYDGANAVNNMIFDNIRIGTLATTMKGNDQNYFFYFPNYDLLSSKSITIQNSQLPQFPNGFNGSVINGNWNINFLNSSVGGIPFSDSTLGLGFKGAGVQTNYS